MQHPDEGTIHAWIDSELSADDASALEAHLAECAECSAVAAEARGLVAASSRIVSALDIVPGDVIPRATPRRPWYASTQLRAAAAVVIVAGASLLVARTGEVKKMERTAETRAPESAAPATVPAEPERDQAAVMNAPLSVAAQPPARKIAKQLSKKKSEVRSEGDLREEHASDEAVALPVPAPSPVAAEKRRFAPSVPLDQVVVTGVATTTSPPELKKIRSDSANYEAVYEVSPGVEVTVIDNGVRADVMMRASAQEKAVPMAAPAPPPLANATAGASAAKVPVFNVISWTDRRGHMMVLKGPLSRIELEALRLRLPEDQR